MRPLFSARKSRQLLLKAKKLRNVSNEYWAFAEAIAKSGDKTQAETFKWQSTMARSIARKKLSEAKAKKPFSAIALRGAKRMLKAAKKKW